MRSDATRKTKSSPNPSWASRAERERAIRRLSPSAASLLGGLGLLRVEVGADFLGCEPVALAAELALDLDVLVLLEDVVHLGEGEGKGEGEGESEGEGEGEGERFSRMSSTCEKWGEGEGEGEDGDEGEGEG